MPRRPIRKKVSKPQKREARPVPYTVADFNREFRNDDVCLEYVKEQRWPKGMVRCAKCGGLQKHYHVSGRSAYACDLCGNHIYPLAGTIFAKSTTPLKTWFYAIYLMASTECAITAKLLQRELGVTYKTAWRLLREIRRSLASGYLHYESPPPRLDETLRDETLGNDAIEYRMADLPHSSG